MQTVIQTAIEFKVSPETVYRAIRIGKLKAISDGAGIWLVSRKDAIKWRQEITSLKIRGTK